MAKSTATAKKVMEKVEINGVIRTEALRLADLKAILEGEQRETAVIEDLKNYITHKQAQVEARKTNSKTDPEKVAKREHIKEAVMEYLTENAEKWFAVNEIIKGSPKLGIDYSTSAVTNVLTELLNEGKVLNEKSSKGSKYSAA